MKIRFGINENKCLTGAELYVRIFQITSLLPILYIFGVSGYPAIITGSNILSFLFDVGMMGIPRAESLALSFAFRLFSSELVVYFALLVIALLFGAVAGKLLKNASYRTAKTSRFVFAALIAIDIIFRLIPVRLNLALGIPAAAVGLALRLACLVLVLLDLRAAKRADQN